LVTAAALTAAVLPQKHWIIRFIAVVVASSKPQIAGPILLVLFLANRILRRQMVWTALAVGVFSVCVLLLDDSPAKNLLAAVSGNSHLGANVSARMIGVGPLLNSVGFPAPVSNIVGWLVLAMVLLTVGYLGLRKHSASSDSTTIVMVGFASTALAYPIHGYDIAVLAPVFGLVGLMSWQQQLALALPMVGLGRPGLVKLVFGGLSEQGGNAVTGILLLGLLGLLLYWSVREAGRVLARRCSREVI
jgi:hypothetical protein